MLCVNGRGLSGRCHGCPWLCHGCFANTDTVRVDVIMVGEYSKPNKTTSGPGKLGTRLHLLLPTSAYNYLLLRLRLLRLLRLLFTDFGRSMQSLHSLVSA